MTTSHDTNLTCESCGFGPGHRTGEIHNYRFKSPVQTTPYALCDDCVSRMSDLVTRVAQDATCERCNVPLRLPVTRIDGCDLKLCDACVASFVAWLNLLQPPGNRGNMVP